MITRRQLLALGAAVAAVPVLGAGGALWSWWDQPAEDPHTHLSADEAAFLVALGEAAWPATTTIPLGGGEARLDRFMDAVLGGMPADLRQQLRLLLHALDHAALPSQLGTFQGLEAPQRQLVLRSWLDSELMELRQAASSVVILLGMGYTTHPEVAPWFATMYGCGYGS